MLILTAVPDLQCTATRGCSDPSRAGMTAYSKDAFCAPHSCSFCYEGLHFKIGIKFSMLARPDYGNFLQKHSKNEGGKIM